MSGAKHVGRPVGRMEPAAGSRQRVQQAPKAGFVLSGTADGDWRHRAECRPERLDAEGLDKDLFFPVGSTGTSLLSIEDAKAVCRRCPVAESCLTEALEKNYTEGVWGGLSEDERRSLKRRAARERSRLA